MREIVAALLISSASVAHAGAYTDDVGRGPRYRLFFPPLKLATDDGERVTAIKVTVTCGYITGVSPIPGDWWMEMRGPISGETTFSASAGHGVSYLWKLKTWNGSIAITPYEASCFDVSAGVITERGSDDKATEHKYSRRQLKLRP
jgi:hypothetical protein